MRGPLLTISALLALGVAFSACGSGESDEDKIVGVITSSAKGHDPAECEQTSTLAFMEQSTDGHGSEAVAACEAEKKDLADDPDKVTVTNVRVSGAKATADVAFAGGNFDGQTLDVALVEEGGDWKLDQIRGFVGFDRASMIGVFEKGFQESAEIPHDLATCLIAALRAESDEALEELILENREGLFKLLQGCE